MPFFLGISEIQDSSAWSRDLFSAEPGRKHWTSCGMLVQHIPGSNMCNEYPIIEVPIQTVTLQETQRHPTWCLPNLHCREQQWHLRPSILMPFVKVPPWIQWNLKVARGLACLLLLLEEIVQQLRQAKRCKYWNNYCTINCHRISFINSKQKT